MKTSAINREHEVNRCRQCGDVLPGAAADDLCTACHHLRTLFPEGERMRERRGHQFVTKAMIETIPALYATDDIDVESKTLYAHYFVGACGWYVAELDPATGLAFGHADLGFPEWGYFDLVEMESILVHGWVIERDLAFFPMSAKELGIA